MADDNTILEVLQEIRAEQRAMAAKVDALPDVALLQEVGRRTQRDLMQFRDDIRVQTAICMRLDTSHSVLLEEVRGMHAQISRMNDIRSIEDAPSL